jgi:hypothetical protein
MQTTMLRNDFRWRRMLPWILGILTGLFFGVNSTAEEYDNQDGRDAAAAVRQEPTPGSSRYSDRLSTRQTQPMPEYTGRRYVRESVPATQAGAYSSSGVGTRYDRSYRDAGDDYLRRYSVRGRSGVERTGYDVPVYNPGPPVHGGQPAYGMVNAKIGGCNTGECNVGEPTCGIGGCNVGEGPEMLMMGPGAPAAPYLDQQASCPCYAATSGSFWVRADYLLWWLKGSQSPSLVTTSNAVDGGILGRDSTEVLFGDKKLNGEIRNGGRFDVGYWFDNDHIIGIEGYYFFLGPSASHFEAVSDGDPLLAQPYLNAENWEQAAHLVAYPQSLQGTIGVRSENGFQGLGALLRIASFERAGGRFYFLAGYRYLQLGDKLFISEYSEFAGPGNQEISDYFRTVNEFNGLDLGAAIHYHADRWSLDLLMKVAFGDSQSIVDIHGFTTTTIQGVSETNSQGLLALDTNSGHSVNHSFAMIPELGITVGFDITSCLRATAGYSILYWSKVARAADQIDTELNLSQLPPGPRQGAPKPQFLLHDEDFWAQGMNIGLELRF